MRWRNAALMMTLAFLLAGTLCTAVGSPGGTPPQGEDGGAGGAGVTRQDTAKPQIVVSYPNGGEVIHGEVEIRWNTLNDSGKIVTVVIDLLYGNKSGLNTLKVLENDAPNTGSYMWNTDTAEFLDWDDCQIQVGSRTYRDVTDRSDDFFTLANDPVVQASLNAKDDLVVKGRRYNVSWQASDPNGRSDRLEISVWWSPFELEGGHRAWEEVVGDLPNDPPWYKWDTDLSDQLFADSDGAAIQVRAEDAHKNVGESEPIVFDFRMEPPPDEGGEGEGRWSGLAEWMRSYWSIPVVVILIVLIAGFASVRAYSYKRSIDEMMRRSERRGSRERRERRSSPRRSGKGKGRGRRKGKGGKRRKGGGGGGGGGGARGESKGRGRGGKKLEGAEE